MNLKKRTPEEIEESVKNKDYTGGYSFIPWLIYMRSWFFIALGISGFGIFSVLRDGFNWAFLIPVVILLITIIALIWDYKTSKKGISK